MEARLAEWNSRRLHSYKGGLFSMVVRKRMKHFQVAITAGFDAETIPGSIKCYTAEMSQLRGQMVGPPYWLTSYLSFSIFASKNIELSRTIATISRHSKNNKKTYWEKYSERDSNLILELPNFGMHFFVLASAFTWSHHVRHVYQIRSTTSTHASGNGNIFFGRKWRSWTWNILFMVISTAQG